MEDRLILAAKKGDESAFSELITKYRPLLDSAVNKYYRGVKDMGGELDDLRQEARLAFYRAIVSFDLNNDGVSFGLYAKICVKNALVSVVRKISADRKRKSSEKSASLPKETGARSSQLEFSALLDDAEGRLTQYEKKVFCLYLDGKHYKEIASLLGKTEKSVDNALFRAKTKLRNGYGM